MRILLLPLSILFRIGVFIKNKLYDWNVIKSVSLGTRVISVGNIAAGGTGKTPFVEFIARYILSKGKFAVILQRGYKRDFDDLKVAEFGFKNENHELNSENFGDEGLLMLENLNNIPDGKGLLIVSDKKSSGAKFADAKFHPDVIIVDDGFQHRKLDRDLDIVIISESENHMLLPAGNMREPESAVFRADVIVINNKFKGEFSVAKTRNKPRVTCFYEFEGLLDLEGKVHENEGITALAFCGIAEPKSFKTHLEKQNVKVGEFMVFPDHHSFSNAEIERIIETFKKSGASAIVTTQKDFVRIKNSELVLSSKGQNIYKELLLNYPLYYAKIKMQISSGQDVLYDKIDELLI